MAKQRYGRNQTNAATGTPNAAGYNAAGSSGAGATGASGYAGTNSYEIANELTAGATGLNATANDRAKATGSAQAGGAQKRSGYQRQ
jgi:hypothetical protein